MTEGYKTRHAPVCGNEMYFFIILFLVFTVISGQDITFNNGTTKTAIVSTGSFLIPNDANWQNRDSNNSTPFMGGTYNRKVYGLINRLVRNDIPIWYISKSGKTNVTQYDDTLISAYTIWPLDLETSATNITLHGGYFLIPKDYTTDAWIQINSYDNSIRVWNTTIDYTETNIRYALTITPKVGLLRGATTVDTQKVETYFQDLGYALNTDWDELDNSNQISNDGAAGHCYTMLILPRTNINAINSNVSLSINNTLYHGLNTMALSDSVFNLESAHAYIYGHGELVACSSNQCSNVTTTDLTPSASFTSFASNSMCTVSERSHVYAFVGTLEPQNTTESDGVHSGIVGTVNGTQYKYAAYGKVTTENTPGGYVYYATGDSWDKCGVESYYDNSLRLIGNAMLTPAAPHADCNFKHSFAPIANWDYVQLPGNGTCYDIYVLDNDYDVEDISLLYSNIILTDQGHSYIQSVSVGNSSVIVCTFNASGSANLETIGYRVLDSDNNTSIETHLYVYVIDNGLGVGGQIIPNTYEIDIQMTNENDIVYIDVLKACADPTGNTDKDTISIVTPPTEGTAAIVTHTFTYPNQPYHSGTKSAIAYTPSTSTVNGTVIEIDYNIHSIYSGLDGFSAPIYITVYRDVDGAPNAMDDHYSALQNQAQLVMNVIDNDTNMRNNFDTTKTDIVSSPSYGNLANHLNGTFVFTHNDNLSGNTSFVYKICNSADQCSNATVHIQIVHVDHAPVTPDQTFYVYTDATSIPLGLLTNVTDMENNVDDSTLLVPSVTQEGITTIVNQTHVYYTSTSSTSVGTDSFTYYICDTTALCSTGTVNVVRRSKVYPVNDIIYYYLNGSQVCVDVSQNDIDYGNGIDATTTSLLQNSTIGTLTNEHDGNICFAYTGNASAIQSVNYQICNTGGYCANAKIYLIPSDDCNLNGIADSVDISSGTSKDCNNNGIPDECDVKYYGSADCNGDGIPDSCQAACANIEYRGGFPI